jgi:hypothetical protein
MAGPLSSPPSPRLPSFSSYPLPRRRRRSLLHRLLPLSLAALFLSALAYWFLYETHIEIALYRRSWISSTIKPTPPLSPTCFADTTSRHPVVHSPTYVDFSPGLAMRHGSDCYHFAGLVPQSPLPGMQTRQQHIAFHTYWRNDLGRLGARELLMLESLIASQIHSSNRIILWSNGPLASEELDGLSDRFPDRIEVRVVDLDTLSAGTPIEGSERLEHIYDGKAWLDGDVVRVLVLWNYGGIWVDMDMIVTRDLSVLTEHEWVEQWDCYGVSSVSVLLSLILGPDARRVKKTNHTNRSTAPSCTLTATLPTSARCSTSWQTIPLPDPRARTGAHSSITSSGGGSSQTASCLSRSSPFASPTRGLVGSITASPTHLPPTHPTTPPNGQNSTTACTTSLRYTCTTSGQRDFQRAAGSNDTSSNPYTDASTNSNDDNRLYGRRTILYIPQSHATHARHEDAEIYSMQ